MGRYGEIWGDERLAEHDHVRERRVDSLPNVGREGVDGVAHQHNPRLRGQGGSEAAPKRLRSGSEAAPMASSAPPRELPAQYISAVSRRSLGLRKEELLARRVAGRGEGAYRVDTCGEDGDQARAASGAARRRGPGAPAANAAASSALTTSSTGR